MNGADSILSVWHKDKFHHDNHVVGSGFTAFVGQYLKSNSMSVVVNVYAA